MSAATTEGWGFPDQSRKCHYFVDTMSLCGEWGFYHGRLVADSGGKGLEDCAECARKMERRRAAGEAKAERGALR